MVGQDKIKKYFSKIFYEINFIKKGPVGPLVFIIIRSVLCHLAQHGSWYIVSHRKATLAVYTNKDVLLLDPVHSALVCLPITASELYTISCYKFTSSF